MANTYTDHSIKQRAETTKQWNQKIHKIVVKLKPESDSQYIQTFESIDKKTNIDKLKFLLDFYNKNK